MGEAGARDRSHCGAAEHTEMLMAGNAIGYTGLGREKGDDNNDIRILAPYSTFFESAIAGLRGVFLSSPL